MLVAIAASSCGRGHFDALHDSSIVGDGVGDGVRDGVMPDTNCPTPPSLTNGLVGWWSFDEPSGNVAFDGVASSDGTLGTGVTRVLGHLGGALAFDGSSGRVDIAGTVKYATHTAPFSLSAWANLTTFNGVNHAPDIMQIATDGSTSPFHVLWSNAPPFDGMSTGDGDGSWIATHTNAEPSLGIWHHVVLVFDGVDAQSLASFTYYLDNVVQSLVSTAGYTSQSNVSRIGAAEGVLNYWTGMIDDVRIYNRALSSGDVAALFTLTCQ
jgi:hypothetical protein